MHPKIRQDNYVMPLLQIITHDKEEMIILVRVKLNIILSPICLKI